MSTGSNGRNHTDFDQTRPHKVLLVDDDPIFRQLIKRLLATHGYDVAEARSTIEAEPLLRAGADMLIVDYRMPNTDGASWIKKLRDRGVSIPIVFCSASAYALPLHAYLRNVLKVDLIVRKPVDEESFIKQIQSLMPRPNEAHEMHWVNEEEPLITDAVSKLLDSNYAEDRSSFAWEREDFEESAEIALLGPDSGEASITVTVPDTKVTARRKTKAAMRDLATLYLSELPSIAQLLREELLNNRGQNVFSLLQAAADQAHMMSGAAGTLEFVEIHKIAAQLEEALREATVPDQASFPLNYNHISNLLNALDLAISQAKDCDGEEKVQTSTVVPLQDGGLLASRFMILSNDALASLMLSSLLIRYYDTPAQGINDAMAVFAALESNPVDILFIDSALSGTTAFDICRMIRCNPRWSNLTIVFLAPLYSSADRDNVFACGANDFIVTPVHETELLMRLGALLHSHDK